MHTDDKMLCVTAPIFFLKEHDVNKETNTGVSY